MTCFHFEGMRKPITLDRIPLVGPGLAGPFTPVTWQGGSRYYDTANFTGRIYYTNDTTNTITVATNWTWEP